MNTGKYFDNIAIVTDSLGMHREFEPNGVDQDNVWPVLLKKALQKHHVKTDLYCERAREMTSLPEIVASLSCNTAILVQIGIVDCVPRVISKKDKYIIQHLEPYLLKFLLDKLKCREEIYEMMTEEIVYTPRKQFLRAILDSIMIAQSKSINIFFIEILSHSKLTHALKNIKEYNLIINTVTNKFDNATIFSAPINESNENNVMHTDYYHLSTKGNHMMTNELYKFLSAKIKFQNSIQCCG